MAGGCGSARDRQRMKNPVFKTTTGPRKAGGFIVELQDGDFVFREGDLGTEMYIIHEGKVEILNQVGGKETVLAVLEKGDFFGEMSVLEDMPRAASARAITDAGLLQI